MSDQNKTTEKFLDMLRQAIEAEKEGYKVYADTCVKMTDELTKKTFQALAEDEKRHIKALNEFYKSHCQAKLCPSVKELFKKSHNQARKTIFSKHLKIIKVLKPDAKALKAYDLAMELEKEGYDLYFNALKEAKTEDEKKLLDFLIEEENAHYKLLEENKEFMENPEEWFLKQEKPIVEG